MKVAGYIRVSTDSEGQKESPKNQEQLILDFLEDGQHDLYDFYIDVQTGTNDNREGLKRLIADAENKKFDVIVAKELSRLCQNVGLTYQLKNIAETKDIHIITLDGRVDTRDASKQAMFGLYAWMHENESQRTSERIKSVFRMKYKNGKFLGSHAPYGYAVHDGKLIMREDYTVGVVRDIFSKYLEGWGHDKIARYLSNKLLPTPSTVLGKSNASLHWGGTSVKKILQNPHYVGDLVQGTLQHLETEKSELEKMMDESHSASRLSAIKGQLEKAVTFDTLTTEMLLRFIEKIEVKEDKSIKIYYKFAMVEGL